MILADKIMEERKKNGWSQEELAARLGVSRQAVSKWESAGSIPDLQRVIQLAELFCVSTDYLLKDEMTPEMLQPSVVSNIEAESSVRRVTMEEANDYLDMKKQVAPMIANGVAMCILSPVVLIVLASLSEGNLFPIPEGIATGVGCTVLLSLVAAAVFLFITCGIREGQSEHLEKEPFETEYGVIGMVKEKRREYESTFTRGIAVGVVLCILAAVPLILAGALNAADDVAGSLAGLLLVIVAIGVDWIVRVCIVKSGFDTLLQEGEYTHDEKQMKKKLDPLDGIYWCLTTAIYLGWSFWSMRWDLTWIIWPVAAVLFVAVNGVMRMIVGRNK